MHINNGQHFFWTCNDIPIDSIALTLRHGYEYLFIQNNHSGNYFLLANQLRKYPDLYNTRLLLI